MKKKGRKIALLEKVKITGSGAILVAAKRNGIIEEVTPFLNILDEYGYRLSKGLKARILKLAGEKETSL